MEQYIPKSALVAEIARRIDLYDPIVGYEEGRKDEVKSILSFINTIEVKEEVDLKEEIDKIWKPRFSLGWDDKSLLSVSYKGFESIAKHFFELGLNASNLMNLESLVRQVIDLYLEAGKHYNSVIEEERKEHGGSDLAIKLFDGVIDAKELSIQYVLDKLKAQEGE